MPGIALYFGMVTNSAKMHHASLVGVLLSHECFFSFDSTASSASQTSMI